MTGLCFDEILWVAADNMTFCSSSKGQRVVLKRGQFVEYGHAPAPGGPTKFARLDHILTHELSPGMHTPPPPAASLNAHLLLVRRTQP